MTKRHHRHSAGQLVLAISSLALIGAFLVVPQADSQVKIGNVKHNQSDPFASLQFGARIDTAGGKISVVYPLVESPAEDAGLQRGDVILKIAGEKVGGNFERYQELLSGHDTPKVDLSIQRGDSVFNLSINRIRLDSLFARWGVERDPSGSIRLPSPSAGESAPRFRSLTVNGMPIELEDFRGRYLLLDFWATWCGPCRIELPNVIKLADSYSSKGLSVVGISSDRRPEDLMRGIQQYGIGFPQIYQGQTREISYAYGVRSIPRTFLIDPEGDIIAVGLRGRQLQEKITALLGPPSAAN